jgi:uncharacterized protein YjdB
MRGGRSIVVMTLGGCVMFWGLWQFLLSPTMNKDRTKKPLGTVTEPSPPAGQPGVPALEIAPRQLPVAGAPGFFVVLKRDGSSELLDPEGKRTPLAAPGKMLDKDVTQIQKAVAAQLNKPAKKVAVGQLVVLEKGVVDVPKDAIITYLDTDRLITLATDGSSTVYKVDGSVETRERPGRPVLETETPQPIPKGAAQ